MQILREMSIWGDAQQFDTLMDEFERGLPGGWSRDRASEVLHEYHGNKPGRYHFRSAGGDGFPACDLILIRLGTTALGVANIIPRDDDRFSFSEHNAALEEFCEEIARPCVEKMGMGLELTSGQFDINRWLNDESVKKLRDFCRLANKGLGGALPLDRDRWLDFVVTAHRDGSKMPTTLLRRWLIEDGGWYFEDADRLAGEYAFGGDVLSYSLNQPARA